MDNVVKHYTIAGISHVEGEATYRFANCDIKSRTGVMKRGGHTDISFWTLPQPMTLEQAMGWLNTVQGKVALLPKGHRKTETQAERKALVQEILAKQAAEMAAMTEMQALEMLEQVEVIDEAPIETQVVDKAAAKRERDAARKRAARAAKKLAKEG